ncbi:hypothetical protein ACFZBC_33000 [Streptomyces luteogriseus]|uniref:hypothetical protein n=1 Tax=Streptomyces luteogriseus TaxID=68233 RepID=UPI0036E7E1AD
MTALIGALLLCLGVILLLCSHLIEGITSDIFHEAGLVLVGTIIVAYIFEFGFRKHHAKVVCDLVAATVVPDAPTHGLQRVVPRMNFQEMFDRLSRGDELLWLDTYCPEQANFQRSLRRAVERGARIRMLAIKPECDNARARAEEIYPHHGYTYEAFRDEAQSNVRHLGDAFMDLKEAALSEVDKSSLRLRLYDDLPCFPMYIILHKGKPVCGYTSFFLRDPSFEEPHLEWTQARDSLLDHFISYFEYKWEKNRASEKDLSTLVREPVTEPDVHYSDGLPHG